MPGRECVNRAEQ